MGRIIRWACLIEHLFIIAGDGEKVNRAAVAEVDAQHADDVLAPRRRAEQVGHLQIAIEFPDYQERRARAVLEEEVARAIEVKERNAVHHLAMRQYLGVIEHHFPAALPLGDDVARPGHLEHREEPVVSRAEHIY